MTSMEQKQQQIEAIMRLAPVIPVVVINDAKLAVPMARALVAGGTPAIEVTLRTPAALDAIAGAGFVPDVWDQDGPVPSLAGLRGHVGQATVGFRKRGTGVQDG